MQASRSWVLLPKVESIQVSRIDTEFANDTSNPLTRFVIQFER
jgi:hypothetical protein